MFELIFGGITGLVGTIATGIFQIRQQKLALERQRLNNEHEVRMVEAETEATVTEANANIQITKTKMDGMVDLAETQAYAETLKQAAKPMLDGTTMRKLFQVEGKLRFVALPAAVLLSFLFGLVDLARAAMRPLLTAYLTGVTTWITWTAWRILEASSSGAIDPAKAAAIFEQVTGTVVYLTTSCVTWWFGDRRMAKEITRIYGKGPETGQGMPPISQGSRSRYWSDPDGRGTWDTGRGK